MNDQSADEAKRGRSRERGHRRTRKRERKRTRDLERARKDALESEREIEPERIKNLPLLDLEGPLDDRSQFGLIRGGSGERSISPLSLTSVDPPWLLVEHNERPSRGHPEGVRPRPPVPRDRSSTHDRDGQRQIPQDDPSSTYRTKIANSTLPGRLSSQAHDGKHCRSGEALRSVSRAGSSEVHSTRQPQLRDQPTAIKKLTPSKGPRESREMDLEADYLCTEDS